MDKVWTTIFVNLDAVTVKFLFFISDPYFSRWIGGWMNRWMVIQLALYMLTFSFTAHYTNVKIYLCNSTNTSSQL